MLDIRGSNEEYFRFLPSYCIELKRTNPDSVSHLIREDNDSFQMLFWAFGLNICSFKRNVILGFWLKYPLLKEIITPIDSC